MMVQSTPDNTNLRGNQKNFELLGVWVIRSLKQIAEGNKKKLVFTAQWAF